MLAVVPATYGTGMLVAATRPAAGELGEAAVNAIRVIGGFGVALIVVALVVGFAQLVWAAATLYRRVAAGGFSPARERWTGPPRFATSRARMLAGLAAFGGVLIVIGLGLAESLVWGPLAQAPGYPLGELYGSLSRGDVQYGVSFVIVWAVVWLLAAVVLLILCLWPSPPQGGLNRLLTPRRVLVVALTIASLTTYWQGWSTFSLGMSIADTLPPYGGGHSMFWGVYTAVGQAAFVVVILRTFIPGPVGRESMGAPASAASAPA